MRQRVLELEHLDHMSYDKSIEEDAPNKDEEDKRDDGIQIVESDGPYNQRNWVGISHVSSFEDAPKASNGSFIDRGNLINFNDNNNNNNGLDHSL